MVTEDEFNTIYQRMAEAGITNAGAYVRKMTLNGYVLNVDLAPVRELVALQRRCSNNLNQIARRANTEGYINARSEYLYLADKIDNVIEMIEDDGKDRKG